MTTNKTTLSRAHSIMLMLFELGIPAHRMGYRQLQMAIPMYILDDTQSLTKHIYPNIAAHWGHSNGCAVEHSIRLAIQDAWQERDPETWAQYFPNAQKVPSNKLFIATLAERLKQHDFSI